MPKQFVLRFEILFFNVHTYYGDLISATTLECLKYWFHSA